MNLAPTQVEGGQLGQVGGPGQDRRAWVAEGVAAQIECAEFPEPGATGEVADALGGVEEVDAADRRDPEQGLRALQKLIRVEFHGLDEPAPELALLRFEPERGAPVSC